MGDGGTVTTTDNPKYFPWLRQDQLLMTWLLLSFTEGILTSVKDCINFNRSVGFLIKTPVSKNQVESCNSKPSFKSQEKEPPALLSFATKSKL